MLPNANKLVAIEKGDKRYVGKICKKHVSGNGVRHVSNNRCVFCTKEDLIKWRGKNKDHVKNSLKKWIEKNKVRHRNKKRLSALRRNSGIDEELFNRLMVEQGGKCAGPCCRKFDDELKPVRDHCHIRNVPRGLLCHDCNILEGQLRKLEAITGKHPMQIAAEIANYRSLPPAVKLATSSASTYQEYSELFDMAHGIKKYPDAGQVIN